MTPVQPVGHSQKSPIIASSAAFSFGWSEGLGLEMHASLPRCEEGETGRLLLGLRGPPFQTWTLLPRLLTA